MHERTHWEGCWREHHECALKRIAELEKTYENNERRLRGMLDKRAVEVDELLKTIAKLEKWKRTMEDEAVTSWCLTEENKDDPRKMLTDIELTHAAWALDPAISSDARALIERGRQESKERIAELEEQRHRLLDDIAEHYKARDDLRARIAELEREKDAVADNAVRLLMKGCDKHPRPSWEQLEATGCGICQSERIVKLEALTQEAYDQTISLGRRWYDRAARALEERMKK